MKKHLQFLVASLAVLCIFSFSVQEAEAADCPNGYTICNDSDCILYNIAVVWIPLEVTYFGGLLVPDKCITFPCPAGATGIFGIAVNGDSYGPGTNDWLDDNCTGATTVVVGDCSAIIN